MANKRTPSNKSAEQMVVIAPVSTSRYTPAVTALLTRYEELVHGREVALEQGLVAEALVILLQIDAVEGQIRHAYSRDLFWGS